MSGRWQRNPDVLTTELDDDWVLLHPVTQEMFTLNATGAAVWDALDQPCPLEGLVAVVAQRFEVDEPTASADIVELLEALTEVDLVIGI